MKRVKKIILIAIVLVILLIGGGVLWIDHLAKLAVETGATYALGVETTLGGMDIGVVGGTVDLSTLNVANPPAFEINSRKVVSPCNSYKPGLATIPRTIAFLLPYSLTIMET